MRSILREDEDEDRESRQPEINLSAASLLGLFVALVLICGVFFGFGYSIGRRPTARAGGSILGAISGTTSGAVPGSAAKLSAKPGSGTAPQVNTSSLPAADLPTPVSGSQASQSVDLPIDETPPPELAPSAASLRRQAPLAKPSPAAPPTPTPVSMKTAAAGSAAISSAAAGSAAAGLPAAGSAAPSAPVSSAVPAIAASAQPAAGTMVQVAAVVHQEDAEVLVSALRRKGYPAVVRNGVRDKLLHVQIGPYSSRAQALAMRQKLLSDGYNAILK